MTLASYLNRAAAPKVLRYASEGMRNFLATQSASLDVPYQLGDYRQRFGSTPQIEGAAGSLASEDRDPADLAALLDLLQDHHEGAGGDPMQYGNPYPGLRRNLAHILGHTQSPYGLDRARALEGWPEYPGMLPLAETANNSNPWLPGQPSLSAALHGIIEGWDYVRDLMHPGTTGVDENSLHNAIIRARRLAAHGVEGNPLPFLAGGIYPALSNLALALRPVGTSRQDRARHMDANSNVYSGRYLTRRLIDHYLQNLYSHAIGD